MPWAGIRRLTQRSLTRLDTELDVEERGVKCMQPAQDIREQMTKRVADITPQMENSHPTDYRADCARVRCKLHMVVAGHPGADEAG